MAEDQAQDHVICLSFNLEMLEMSILFMFNDFCFLSFFLIRFSSADALTAELSWVRNMRQEATGKFSTGSMSPSAMKQSPLVSLVGKPDARRKWDNWENGTRGMCTSGTICTSFMSHCSWCAFNSLTHWSKVQKITDSTKYTNCKIKRYISILPHLEQCEFQMTVWLITVAFKLIEFIETKN